ncbi:MAG: hypothetical protein ACRC26_10455, partial [Bacteroidales bacterium]
RIKYRIVRIKTFVWLIDVLLVIKCRVESMYSTVVHNRTAMEFDRIEYRIVRVKTFVWVIDICWLDQTKNRIVRIKTFV